VRKAFRTNSDSKIALFYAICANARFSLRAVSTLDSAARDMASKEHEPQSLQGATVEIRICTIIIRTCLRHLRLHFEYPNPLSGRYLLSFLMRLTSAGFQIATFEVKPRIPLIERDARARAGIGIAD